MHLDEEQVQRLLHDELEARQRAEVAAHVELCDDCRARVEGARREEVWLFGLLERLDHPLPVRRTRWARWAAVIALVLAGAGVAYAIPGSPLRGWVDRAAGWLSEAGEGRREAPEMPETDPAGIAFEPSGRLAIVIEATGLAGSASVSLTDGAEVVVRARRGRAVFATDIDRLVVRQLDAAVAYDIAVPSGAPLVELVANGRVLWRKQGTRILSDSAADAAGRYRVRF